jgi:hypothetical protein
MKQVNLVLTIPQGSVIATSLGIEAYAWHRSPGSAKYFRGRSVLVDLALKDQAPGFDFLDEGGWRDAKADTVASLAAAASGKRTKTALSNYGFGAIPLSAYQGVHLVKTSAKVLPLKAPERTATFTSHSGALDLTSDGVAQAAGLPAPGSRRPRLYLVLAPVEFLLLSNLTPEEYIWYSTHRTGKMFRQVMFTELDPGFTPRVVADSVYQGALRELEDPKKKTKTLVSGDCLNDAPFAQWAGYASQSGGLYVGDRSQAMLWRFPAIPRNWERADG